VREALRILAVEGLLAIRTGRNGGAEVLLPSRSTVERSVDIFIRGQGVRFEAVLEARQAIEPQAARLAALHHTPDDWAALQRCHQAVQQASADGVNFLQANLDWHLSVVQAGHNELLIAFVAAFARPMYQATTLEDFNSAAIRQAVVQAHQRVMDAIAAGNADAAGRRMGRHVGAYVARARPSAATPNPI
jgi:DNA-binding FadR family transcriptional regulator